MLLENWLRRTREPTWGSRGPAVSGAGPRGRSPAYQVISPPVG